jgi:hypothetical protein
MQAMKCRGNSATILLACALMLSTPAGAQTLDAGLLPQSHEAIPAGLADWREARSFASPDAMYRSCRRQVRRAAGIIPGKRMRLPRAYHAFIDRCVANGGVYG